MSMGFAAPIKVFSFINLDRPFHSSPRVLLETCDVNLSLSFLPRMASTSSLSVFACFGKLYAIITN